MIGRASGVPRLAFSYPLRDDDGWISGVLFVSVDLIALSATLRSASIPHDATLAVLDWNGTVLARSVDAVASLQAFSRRETREPRPILLNVVVLQMHDMIQRIAGDDIRLVTELFPDLGCVNADPAELQQIPSPHMQPPRSPTRGPCLTRTTECW